MSNNTDRLQLILSVANEGFWEWNLKTDQLYLSPQYCALTGYSPDDTVFNSAFMKLIVHPDDQEVFFKAIRGPVGDKKNLSILEYRIIAKDSSTHWIECRFSKLEYDTKVNTVHIAGTVIDITKRKKAEEELRQSEARYRSLFQNKHNVMLIVDQENGTIVDANPAAVAYYGWSWDELCRMNIKQINQLTDQEVQSEMQLALNEKRNYFLFRHLLANGSIRDVEVFSGPITIQNKTLLYSIINDITKRKAVEESFLKSEARFRRLFENHSAVMILLDPDSGSIIDANNAAARFYGWSVEKLKTMSIHQITSVSEEEALTNMNKARTSEQNQFLFRHNRADGSLRDVEVFSNNIEIEGKDLLYAIIHDITDRRLAENQLKKMSAAVEQSPTVVIITDPVGHIEYVNPSFTKLTGFSSEEALGKNPRILQSGLTLQTTYEYLWQTILSGGIWHGEMQNKKKNGDLFWEKSVISSIINQKGEITNFVAVFEDVTEQKRNLNELIAAKEQAEESDRLKSAFLANISHEIRTPMNGILGFSVLLKEPKLTGTEQAEYIDLIHQSGERMLNLINDIIDISRIEAGEKNLQISEITVNEMMLDIKTAFQPEANSKGLRLTCTTALADNESIITTDSEKLNQILTNLIRNALKFTSKGGVDIGYTKKEGTLEFYVIDSGVGIPKEMKDKIFEQFRQVDNSLTRNHEGSGLGLSITKSYVEMLGGTLVVESLEGAGSKFSFTLPYSTSESRNIEHPTARTQPPPDAAPVLTILIVEDDEVSSLLLKKNLKGDNISLLLANNGWEALRLVEYHPEINLVLMDIKMPVMNGYEATIKIKQLRPDLTVIAQSAFTSKVEIEEAYKAGCDAFLTKPIDKYKLLEAMKDAEICPDFDIVMPDSPQPAKERASSPNIKAEPWTLVRNEWSLFTPDGKKIKLTAKEFNFVTTLLSKHKQVVTRPEIMPDLAVPDDETRSGALEAMVHRLRHKTKTADHESPIKTTHGVGYSFTADINII